MSDEELAKIKARREAAKAAAYDGSVGNRRVSDLFSMSSNDVSALVAEVLRLRAERDAAVAEAARAERERAANMALALAKTRFSFSDQPWVCSEIAAAIRRGE